MDAMGLANARHVIDIGTGAGTLLPDLCGAAPNVLIVGVDRSFGMLRAANDSCKMQDAKCKMQNAKRKMQIELAQMDAGRLGLRSGAFDAAIMAFMLFHVDSPPAALAEAARILRPGGTLGIATWAEPPDCEADVAWREELD